jgi:arylformamidase
MRIVDLTLPLSHAMPAFPGEPTVGFVPFATLDRDDVEMSQISFFTQIGTHLDAPSHFVRAGRTVDRIELDRCVGPATVVDARGADALGLDVFDPSLEGLRRTRRALVQTDWSARFGEPGYWTEFPSMTVEAATALVEAGVVFLGLDTPSPHARDFRALHEALFAGEMVVAECLTRLAALRQPEVFLIALPLPFQGLDGSPIRAVAIDEPTSRFAELVR